MYSKLRKNRGFSLVETLVAITVLLIAVLAPMRISSQSVKTAGFVREQLTAVFLAQEGIELVIQLRDNDALNGGSTWGWYSSLLGACKNTSQGCSYNASTATFVSCATIANCRLYFNESGTGDVYYTHTAGTLSASPFTRVVTVTEERTGEVQIISTVSWDSTLLQDTVSVTARTRIFDQYEPES